MSTGNEGSTFNTSITYQTVVIALITAGVIGMIIIAVLFRRYRYHGGRDPGRVGLERWDFDGGRLDDGPGGRRRLNEEMETPIIWEAELGRGGMEYDSKGQLERHQVGKGKDFDEEKRRRLLRFDWKPLSMSLPPLSTPSSDSETNDVQPNGTTSTPAPAMTTNTIKVNNEVSPSNPSTSTDATRRVEDRTQVVMKMTVLVALPDPNRHLSRHSAPPQTTTLSLSDLDVEQQQSAVESIGGREYDHVVEYRYDGESEGLEEGDLPLLELGTADVFVYGDVDGLRKGDVATSTTTAAAPATATAVSAV